MSTYRLPIPLATHRPLWLRVWESLQSTWSTHVAAQPQAATAPLSEAEWDALRDLPPALQRDIGLPEALVEHGRQIRERDALWIRI